MSRGRRSSSPSSLYRKQSTATTPLLASSSSSSSFSSMNRTSSVSSLSTVFHSAEEDGRREEEEGVGMEEVEEDMWSNLLPELLGVIIKMVEESEEAWPRRRNLVACAGVCKRWREVVIGTVESVGGSGKITFPLSLKQPGPKELPVQCFVKRNRKTSTFYLYLDLKEASKDVGKFLMAARRYNYSTHIEYIISLDADDLSERSNAYVGKLRSSFLGTKFKIYDTRPPFSGAKVSSSRASRRFGSKQISPKVPSGNFTIGHVAYQFNVKCRGPRRISCTLRNSPYYETSEKEFPERSNKQLLSSSEREFIRLKNNTPRWHHQLKCWCLNFYGRVTVASVKNFQLSIAEDPCQYRPLEDPEAVVLQFGKTSDNIFTMDYRHPLSAFQAFAICLTSFGNKLACE